MLNNFICMKLGNETSKESEFESQCTEYALQLLTIAVISRKSITGNGYMFLLLVKYRQ